MKVLVTGGSGFVGKHVLATLALTDHEVIAPSHADYDLCDPMAVMEMYRDHHPNATIHLAALVGGIGANQGRPADFWHANTLMGANIFHSCRVFGCRNLVMLGTVCSYPINPQVPFHEDDLWLGYPEPTNAPYGIAKRSLMVAADAFRKQYGLNTKFLIPTNLYGPGDHFNYQVSHVIPALIRKMHEATKSASHVTLWGTGRATRDFLYVEDAAKAIVMALHRDFDVPVNLGTGEDVSIKYLAHIIAGMMGYTREINWDTDKPDGQPRRQLDTSRAKTILGWAATTGLTEGLGRTIDWYLRSHLG